MNKLLLIISIFLFIGISACSTFGPAKAGNAFVGTFSGEIPRSVKEIRETHDEGLENHSLVDELVVTRDGSRYKLDCEMDVTN